MFSGKIAFQVADNRTPFYSIRSCACVIFHKHSLNPTPASLHNSKKPMSQISPRPLTAKLQPTTTDAYRQESRRRRGKEGGIQPNQKYSVEV